MSTSIINYWINTNSNTNSTAHLGPSNLNALKAITSLKVRWEKDSVITFVVEKSAVNTVNISRNRANFPRTDLVECPDNREMMARETSSSFNAPAK